MDDQGYALQLPCIWQSNSYGQTADGIKILSLRSAMSASSLYSIYLVEEAIVWDSAKKELFLYVPDEKYNTVAFKGGSWLGAKKLKHKYTDLNIRDIYLELKSKIID